MPTRPAALPDADHARAPSLVRQLGEWRGALDWMGTLLPGEHLDGWPHGDGHPVLVVPGFMADGAAMGHLRSTLRRLDYRAHDWGQGRNLGLRPGVAEAVQARVAELAERYGRPVSLVGWSLGGIFAREAARRAPDQVRQVITLGSPFRGDHTATAAWRAYAALNHRHRALSPMGEAARAARSAPLPVPTTCVFSRKDGIVAWECCTSLPAPRTENVEVDCTHLGLIHHRRTLHVVADRLAQPEGTWQPYEDATAAR